MNKLKQMVRNNKLLASAYRAARRFVKSIKFYFSTKKVLKDAESLNNRIFYIGMPAHANLGDLAQWVCIKRWLKKHYPEKNIVEIKTNSLVNTYFSLLPKLQEIYDNENDFVVFQSGYATTDLGGYADEMHRAVMKALPEAKMLMLPQTIFFEKEENKNRTAKVYNAKKNMLFLARDSVSYGMAKEMFPDIPVELYPDIVTTLIGTKEFNNEREGILFCCRNDEEKYYSDEEIDTLMKKCESLCKVTKTDTTKGGRISEIILNAEKYIANEIEEYSKYKVIITDRYHGTILSLVAGTPVVIIKSTDHKVTTGADWFKGLYDSHVYVAGNLDEAYTRARQILTEDVSHKLDPYFEREYYDRLAQLFEETCFNQ